MADMNEWVDAAIPCEYGGCTVDAPCRNHLAYRHLPEIVKSTITAKMQEIEREARLQEAKLARKQFIVAVDDSDFIVANGERIAELSQKEGV